jgi:hypothetical protein
VAKHIVGDTMTISVVSPTGVDWKKDSLHRVLVDGEVIPPEHVQVTTRSAGSGVVDVLVNGGRELTNRVLSSAPREIADTIGMLTITMATQQHLGHHYIKLTRVQYFQLKRVQPRLSFQFVMDVANFKQLWSPSEYRTMFWRLFTAEPIPGLTQSEDLFMYGIGLDTLLSPDDLGLSLVHLVERWKPTVDALHERTRLELAEQVRADAVVTQFAFPSHLRVACEQYLLFFIQFLAELGIDATADMRHEAGELLFSVTPKEGAEALDRVRRALELYLELPKSINPATVPMGGLDIPTQQLYANLQFLNAQMSLAQAQIQARDATIQAKDATIEAQRHTINMLAHSGAIVAESVRSVSVIEKGQEKETIMGGTVSITPYKKEGRRDKPPRALQASEKVDQRRVASRATS